MSDEVRINDKGHVEFDAEKFGGPPGISKHGMAQDVAVNWPDKADQVRELFFNWMDAKADAAKKNIDDTLAQRKVEYDAYVKEYSEKRRQDAIARDIRRAEQEKLAEQRKEEFAEEMLDAMERVKQKRAKK